MWAGFVLWDFHPPPDEGNSHLQQDIPTFVIFSSRKLLCKCSEELQGKKKKSITDFKKSLLKTKALVSHSHF